MKDMTMRILLISIFFIAFSIPAFAEGNKITVVGEDGTVTSIDIGPSPLEPSAEPADKPVNLRRAPPAADPAPVEKPAKKAASKKPDAKKESKKETPVKKEAKKKKAATPAKKDAKKDTKKTAKKNKSQKKQAATASPAPLPDRTPSRPVRLGPNMTPDDAIRIALDVAPPARSVNAIPVNYKGLHAYQVVFSTEDGNRSIFIDRETGKIVK